MRDSLPRVVASVVFRVRMRKGCLAMCTASFAQLGSRFQGQIPTRLFACLLMYLSTKFAFETSGRTSAAAAWLGQARRHHLIEHTLTCMDTPAGQPVSIARPWNEDVNTRIFGRPGSARHELFYTTVTLRGTPVRFIARQTNCTGRFQGRVLLRLRIEGLPGISDAGQSLAVRLGPLKLGAEVAAPPTTYASSRR